MWNENQLKNECLYFTKFLQKKAERSVRLGQVKLLLTCREHTTSLDAL